MRQAGIDLGDLAEGQDVHSFGAVIDLRSVPDGTAFSRRELDGHRVFSLAFRRNDSTAERADGRCKSTPIQFRGSNHRAVSR
jgi:hypothetical protein